MREHRALAVSIATGTEDPANAGSDGDRTRLMLVVMVMATPRELFLLQDIAAMDWFGRASQHVKDWEFLGFDTA